MSTPYATGLTDQLARLRARLDAGMPRLGWKVGINVPEVQRKLGLSHSLVGWLDGERTYASGAAVPIPQQGKIHVEPELCLRLAKPVNATADRATALAAVDAIAPALELVDYARPAADLHDLVAGSMFHHASVIGTWQPPRETIDVWSHVTLRVGSMQSEPARADLVPVALAELVLMVARLLGEAGQQLLSGDHILSGSFTAKALPLTAAELAEATLGDYGSVRCSAV